MGDMDHIDEAFRAVTYIEEAGPILVREALAVLAEHPRAEGAGLIMDKGSPEWAAFRTSYEQSTGIEINAAVFFGAVPRAMAERILLGAGDGDAAVWLDAVAAAPERKLPIVAMTKNGVQRAVRALPDLGAEEG